MGIAILYLKYNDHDQNLENLLGSLLTQLVQCAGKIPETVSTFYPEWDTAVTPPSLDFIRNETLSLVKSFSEVFLVIDALDECSDEVRWGILDHLRCLGSHAHLLITSRTHGAIGDELAAFDRIEVSAQKDDIDLFVEHRMSNNKNLQRLADKSPTILNDIKEGVSRTAQGM